MVAWIVIVLLSAGTTALLSVVLRTSAAWWFFVRIPLLFFAAYVLWLLLYALFVWIVSCTVDKDKPVTKPNHFLRRLMVETMEVIMLAGRIRVRGEGLEKIDRTKPFLLVANHRSMIDPFLPLSLLKGTEIIFVCKPEIRSMPVAGGFAHGCGFPFIDRTNNREALKAILRAADILKEEQTAVGIFPEGTRNKTDAPLLPLHAGSFALAKRANVPIVVAVNRGTNRALKQFFWHGTKVSFSVLDVIPPERFASRSTQEIADEVRNTLETALRN